MFRPDIYLVILKIALKMSFWYSKNKILAKVPNHLTATVSSDTSVKKIFIYIYSGRAPDYAENRRICAINPQPHAIRSPTQHCIYAIKIQSGCRNAPQKSNHGIRLLIESQT